MGRSSPSCHDPVGIPSSTSRVFVGDRWSSWSDLVPKGPVDVLREQRAPCALVCGTLEEAWQALAAVVATEADALIISRDRCDAEMLRRLRRSGYRVVSDGRETARPSGELSWRRGRITVVSSGTTGRPRLVPHSVHTLGTTRRLAAQPPRRWLCPYAAGTYAWYQCALLALHIDEQDVVPVDPASADDWIERAERCGVNAISATPTFWRRAFLAIDDRRLRALPLTQVSLGGEPVDQPLLDRLRALYPAARVTHIYASSEAGACLVVSDGRAGFPRSWLDAPRPSGVALAVRGGRLLVRSPWANLDALGKWLDTGDRVRVTDDRIEVVGRAENDSINVGGAKVSIDDVTRVLSRHPDVVWCRVRARRAPLVGEVPVAEVVLRPDSGCTESALISWCRARMAYAAAPRIIFLLSDVPSTLALKAEA